MSTAIEKFQAAQQKAMAGRPKVGGFPYLAETLRRAGVTRNFWYLPSCQSLYLTEDGPVVTIGTPLVTGTVDVPPFNREALIAALRIDQAGQSTFPEFLAASFLGRGEPELCATMSTSLLEHVPTSARTTRNMSKAIPPST